MLSARAAEAVVSGVYNGISGCVSTAWSGAYRVSNYFLGSTFRDIFLMPLNGARKLHPSTQQACKDIINDKVPDPQRPQKKDVLNEFKVTELEEMQLDIGGEKYRLHMRMFESSSQGSNVHTCVRIGGNDETLDGANLRIYPLLAAYSEQNKSGKGLRLIQFSFYGNECQPAGTTGWQPWKPVDAAEAGHVVFEQIRHLQEKKGYKVDSLYVSSLGNMIFDVLDGVDPAFLPKALILDRPLSSIWKVGAKLYPLGVYLLYPCACGAGFAANPEKALPKYFNYLKMQRPTDLANRKLVLIEVKEDRYFSGVGAFDNDFVSKLKSAGVPAHRKCYDVNEIAYAKETNHSLASNLLFNSEQKDSNEVFPVEPYESLASSIVKNVFLEER